jgi:hypothetical protein
VEVADAGAQVEGGDVHRGAVERVGVDIALERKAGRRVA